MITLPSARIARIAPGTLITNTEALPYVKAPDPGTDFAQALSLGNNYILNRIMENIRYPLTEWEREYGSHAHYYIPSPTLPPGTLLTVLQVANLDTSSYSGDYLLELLEVDLGKIWCKGWIRSKPVFKMIVDPEFPKQ